MSIAAIAINRFGLGARPDDSPPADPKAWLYKQFDHFEPRPIALSGVPSRTQVAQSLRDYLDEARVARRDRRALMTSAAMPADGQMPQADGQRRLLRRAVRDEYLVMAGARLNAALTAPAPFAERLVHFWANHFAVSVDKLPVIGMAGLLEFEAIRPHLLGKFSDMLLAVEQHPAMLLYLDQAQSIGPNSLAAERAAGRGGKMRGLNENLAREILELHTLGVRTGYSQADVTEFARALTGWTVGGIASGPAARMLGNAAPGSFQFAPALHEPGDRTIMGRRYAQQGEGQARQVLLDVAASPATAHHLATKLARHFAGDDPPQAMVERLSNSYLASGGELPALYRALIESPEAWGLAPTKFKTPWEWSVSALRALGERKVPDAASGNLLTQLGQPTWKPGSPAGWDDVASSWAGPDALVRRVEAAQRMADRAGPAIDPRALARKLFPDGTAEATKTAIARAESPQQGLSLLLVSPEFLRR